MIDLRSNPLPLLLSGAVAGLLYGLAVRICIESRLMGPWFGVMSLAFLFLLPFAIGFLSIYLAERREPQPVWTWFVFPWIGVAGGTFAAMMVFLEGAICVVMFLPVGLLLSTIGGVAAGLVARRQRRKQVRDVI